MPAVRRADLARLRDSRRLLAIFLIGLTGGVMLAFLIARGGAAGSDALAYWGGVRVWLAGGDVYAPPDPFMPWPYAPWLLPLFLPFGLLPWPVAWFAWRVFNVLVLAWSLKWAYDRRPVATAVAFAVMAVPIAATLDTGNVTFLLAMAVWVAQFTGPRLAGMLWAATVSTKWFPVLLFPLLPPRARPWGLAALAVAVVLSLATWPDTLHWVTTMISFPRPPRIDYVLLLWAAIPWAWRRPDPLRGLRRAALSAAAVRLRVAWRAWLHRWRQDREGAAAEARRGVETRLRTFFGVPRG